MASLGTAVIALWIPFMDNVNRLFQKRFCYSQISAGNVVTLSYLVAVGLCVPLGLIVDHFGKRRHLAVAGLMVFFLAQFIMLVYPQCQQNEQQGAIAGLILEGVGYAFYATVFISSIPLVCRLKLLGTAFGFMSLLQNIFQFLIPIVTGLVVQNA